jgi:CubicO group peptidase (beta-lactamase class C family)
MTRRAFQSGVLWTACGSGANAAPVPEAKGTWSGVLDAGSQRLRLELHIGADNAATISSVDQGGGKGTAGRIKLWTFDQVEVEFPPIHATFTGRLTGLDRMEGVWHQGVVNLPLVFERGEAALAPLAPPQPLTRERLTKLRVEAGSPALAAACARRGFPARVWVDGERAVGTGIAVQETDLWHLGSITKSMTASLVGRLVDAGAVSWDETVGDVLGALAPDMLEAYKPATFRHLLSHRTGMPKDLPMDGSRTFSYETADAREERKSFVRLALAMTPTGAMTTTFEYSNSGYVIVGAMLEAELGNSWEELIQRHLFEPLGLLTAGFGAPGHKGATDQPVGHAKEPQNGAPKAYPVGSSINDNPVVIGPSGRVHMSLQDLLRFLGVHRDFTDYLKPETWTTLHTPPFGGNYALGWAVRSDGALMHDGSNTLWYASVLVDSATGIVATAAANYGDLPTMMPIVGRTLMEAAAAA